MKKISMYFIVMALLMGLGSCAKKISFPVSDIVPAAQADAKIKQDKNGNYNIGILIKYLADPGRLDPPRKVYVIWMATEDNRILNMGQIKTRASKKTNLNLVTSFKPVQLFITAEKDPEVQIPGAIEIFRSQRFKL